MNNPLTHDAGQIHERPLNGADFTAQFATKPIVSAIHSSKAEAPFEDALLPQTVHGADVRAICKRASEWACHGLSSIVKMDHLLLALTETEAGADALVTSGVADIQRLKLDLLNAACKMPMPSQGAVEKPVFEDCVLALLNHALGYARRHGRDSTTISDVMSALADAIKQSDANGGTLEALKKLLPGESQVDEKRELLLRIREALADQPSLIVKQIAEELSEVKQALAYQSPEIIGPIAEQLARLEQGMAEQPQLIIKELAEELSRLNSRIVALEHAQSHDASTKSTTWRRLNGALFTVMGTLISAAALGLWTISK